MSRGIVLAARNDGFGSRMVAFLNAMYVAEACELDFRFIWPSMKEIGAFHVVPTPDKVFSRAYRRAHQSPPVSRSRLARVPNEEFSTEWSRDMLRDSRCAGLHVDVCHAAVKLNGRSVAYDAFPRLWSTIGWTPSMRRLMQRAADQVQPNTVAVHLRRGDIVAGVSRYRLFNAKYAPLGWYHRIIGDLLGSGTPVLLFCDDAMVQRALTRRFPEVQIIDRGQLEALSPFERDIFEFSAMAGCSRIVGGNSGFSYLAGLVSGRPCELPETLIPAAERGRLIEADLAEFAEDYSPLHRAKELQWLALELPELLEPGDRDALLSEASRLDPDCPAYPRLRAVEMAERGDFDGAERVLSAAVEAIFARSGRTVSPLPLLQPDFLSLDRPYRGTVPAPPDPAVHPMVAIVAAVQASATGSRQRVEVAAVVRPVASDVLLAFHAEELIASGDIASGLGVLEAAIAGGHDVPLFRRLAMTAARKLRRVDRALAHGLAALAATPADPALALRVAELHLKTGSRAAAIELALAIDQLAFLLSQDVLRLARLLQKLGYRREAERAVRRAVELNPANPVYLRALRSMSGFRPLLDALKRRARLARPVVRATVRGG